MAGSRLGANHHLQAQQVQHIQHLLQLQCGLALLQLDDEAVAGVAQVRHIQLRERDLLAARSPDGRVRRWSGSSGRWMSKNDRSG